MLLSREGDLDAQQPRNVRADEHELFLRLCRRARLKKDPFWARLGDEKAPLHPERVSMPTTWQRNV